MKVFTPLLCGGSRVTIAYDNDSWNFPSSNVRKLHRQEILIVLCTEEFRLQKIPRHHFLRAPKQILLEILFVVEIQKRGTVYNS